MAMTGSDPGAVSYIKQALAASAARDAAQRAAATVASGRVNRLARLQAARQAAAPVPQSMALEQWQPNFRMTTPPVAQQVPLNWQYGGRGMALDTTATMAPAAAPAPFAASGVPATSAPPAFVGSATYAPQAAVGSASTPLAAQLATDVAPVAGVAEAAAPATGLAALGGKAGLMRAGAYGAAGYFGGQLTNKLIGEHPGTSWDEAATGAVTGAGIGAGAGVLGGPFAPISVPVGAGIGALLGGAVGLFGPKSTGPKAVSDEFKTQTAKFNSLADQLKMAPEDRTAALGQLQAIAATAKGKKDVSAAGDMLLQSLPQLQAQAVAQRQESARQIAVQSMLAGFMDPYLRGAQASASESQQYQNQLADTVGGQLGQTMRARAANQKSGSDALTAAYASQVAIAPQMQQQDAIGNIQKQAMAQIYAQLAAKTSASLGYGQQSGSNFQQQLAALNG